MARPISQNSQDEAKRKQFNDALLQECERQIYVWYCVYRIPIKDITARSKKLFDNWAGEGGYHHHATEKQWRTKIKKWIVVWQATCKEGDHWDFDPPELADLPLWDFATPPGVKYEPSCIPSTTCPWRGSLLDYDLTSTLLPPTESGAQSSFSAPTTANAVSTYASAAPSPSESAFVEDPNFPFEDVSNQTYSQDPRAMLREEPQRWPKNQATRDPRDTLCNVPQPWPHNLALAGSSHLNNPYMQGLDGLLDDDGGPEM